MNGGIKENLLTLGPLTWVQEDIDGGKMKIALNGRLIGDREPCFIIAEAGVNHNGDMVLAKELIDQAKEAGADAIKFQTFNTEDLVTHGTEKAHYQISTTGNGTQYEMLKELELSEHDFGELVGYAKERGITFLSTPFDEPSVDLLERLDIPAFKIGSGDLTNLPFLRYVAAKQRPMIVSTGMATMDEVMDAMNAIRTSGNDRIALLHCTSNYPAKIEDCNLRAMDTLRDEFKVAVGYSDHTLGITIPIAAVAMGASIIEKHFTLDNSMPGPDHKASLEPEGLREMIRQIRSVENAFGTGRKEPVQDESENKRIARRSIVARTDIPKGTVISGQMLAVKRPGTGLAPKHMDEIIGHSAIVDIRKDQVITRDMVG